MAGLASVSFSMVLYPSNLLFKEMLMRQLALYRFSSKATIRTASKLRASCSSTRDLLFPVNRINSYNLLAPEDLPCQIVSSSSVGSCTRITGYWVGPDIDDGWGFVEAVIYQTA